MSDLMKFFGVVAIAVLIPYAIILGVYFDFLPESLEVLFSQLAVIAAVVIIVGGNLLMIYQDIKTGRYKKQS
jgi:hypothetical protein